MNNDVKFLLKQKKYKKRYTHVRKRSNTHLFTGLIRKRKKENKRRFADKIKTSHRDKNLGVAILKTKKNMTKISNPESTNPRK